MCRIMKCLSIVLLACFLATGVVYAERMSYYDFEQKFPEDTFLLFYSGGMSAAEELGAETAPAAIWRDEGLKDVFLPVYRNVMDMLGDIDKLPPELLDTGVPLFEGLWQSPWCLVVEPLDMDFTGDSPPDEMDFMSGLSAALMLHAPKDSRAREAVDGLTELIADELDPEMLEEDGPLTRLVGLPLSLAWGLKQDLFVVSVGEGMPDMLLSTDHPGPGEKLVNIRKRLSGDSEPLLLLKYDYGKLVELFRRIGEEEGDAEFMEFFERLQANMPRSLAWAMTAEGKGYITRSKLRMFDPEALQPDVSMSMDDLRMVPVDARLFLALAFDLADSYDRMEELFRLGAAQNGNGENPILEAMESLEEELGFSIRDDMLGSVGERAVAYVPRRSNLLMMPDPIISIELSDAETFRSCLLKTTKLIEQIFNADPAVAFSDGVHENTPFQFARIENPPIPFNPAWAVTGSHFVMAGTIPTLKFALDRIGAEPGDSILASEDFGRTANVIGRDRFTSLSYLAPGAKEYVMDILYSLLPLYTAYASEVPFLEELGFDPSVLPPPERLSRHLFGSMNVSYIENDVVMSEGYGPLCGSEAYIGGAAGVGGIAAAMLMPALARARGEARKVSCMSNLRQIGLTFALYQHDNRGMMPQGDTTGEVFQILEQEGYIANRTLLVCPENPIEKVDFDDPDGVGYYVDPAVPEGHDPRRAIAADRPPWDHNHGDGVNVLFADFSVMFVRPEDSGPPDKISNPRIEEDTDIYADTGDPEKHAWIRWEREPEE